MSASFQDYNVSFVLHLKNMSEMFDLKRIKRLVVLMKENGLSELDIQQGDLRVQLKRQTVSESHLPEIRHYEPHSAVPPPVNPAAPALPSNTVEIKSPMVGTFYSASSPDTPPFVKIGDIITPEKTVCLIEAMKVYNEIQAECSGKIIAVLAENGTAVEFGQPLFRLSAD